MVPTVKAKKQNFSHVPKEINQEDLNLETVEANVVDHLVELGDGVDKPGESGKKSGSEGVLTRAGGKAGKGNKHTMSIQEQEDEQSDEGDVKDLKLSGGMDLESDTNRSENEDVKPEKGSFSHIEGKIEKAVRRHTASIFLKESLPLYFCGAYVRLVLTGSYTMATPILKLTPLDFNVWGHTKNVVYEVEINTKDQLRERIADAAN
ncbi:hypothetical protein GEV33_011054 [Tenebrio molitor]|uniref:Uncharacterized protein n=1 Tax=Tenebrio molitor TaxID=7067 RepID=A0A8J6HC87_TENMO|nr:hypothetical protein GEV33_011054 [Tenebrio molitor]